MDDLETSSPDDSSLPDVHMSRENSQQHYVPHLTKVTRHSLECPFCQERFTKPVRKLECSHSFCEACLKAMAVTGKLHITCPVCNEETAIPKGGVTNLAEDKQLNNQVDDASKFDEHNRGSSIDAFFDAIDHDREDWPEFVSI